MTNGIAMVEVKKQRGKLVVQAIGTTPRGQKFLGEAVVLTAPSIAAPNFKSEMAAAVEKLYQEDLTESLLGPNIRDIGG